LRCLGVHLWRFSVAPPKALFSPSEQKPSEVLAEHLKMSEVLITLASEDHSWDRSLPIVAHDLIQAKLGHEMLIEYKPPLTSKRADVVLAGVDRRTGGDAYVVVELKQWSSAEVWDDDPRHVLVQNMPGKPQLHPVLQATSYGD
jgi:hypothetical protein